MTEVIRTPSERRLLRLHPDDDCLVAAISLRAGEEVDVEGTPVKLEADLPVGHKIAAHALGEGQPVRKCGAIIGRTTVDVGAGEHLHLHNLRSDYLPAHLVGGADAGERVVAVAARARSANGEQAPTDVPAGSGGPAVLRTSALAGPSRLRTAGPRSKRPRSPATCEAMAARASGTTCLSCTSSNVLTTWPGKSPWAPVSQRPKAPVSRWSGSPAATPTTTPKES